MLITLDKYELQLHSEPLDILERFTQKKPKSPEAGGVILGKVVGKQINIIRLSVPTPLDRSSRFNFERHKTSAQIILDYEFHNSNGQMVYLGEWHTHPEPFPNPSPTDIRMIEGQYKNNKIWTDFLVLLIKGTTGLYIRIVEKNGYLEVSLDNV